MSDNIEFVDGFRVYAPNENAPDYIIANVALENTTLVAWLSQHPGLVRLVIKRSKGGKYYAQVDTYKRDTKQAPSASKSSVSAADDGFDDSEIPF